MRCIYLSGPMAGHPDHNFPQFRYWTAVLRDRGWDVYSPHEHDDELTPDEKDAIVAGDYTWARFLRRDIAFIASTADAVAVMPGWTESRGARLEAFVAHQLLKPVFFVETMSQVPATKLEELYAIHH